MRFHLYILVCLIAVSYILPAQEVSNSHSTAGKTYAVIIGIASYQNKSIQLQYSDKDAMLFAGYLQSKPGGNLPDSQMRVLTNEKATIAAIYDALDWVKNACKEGDLVYFYFSGHGDLETQNDTKSEGYLLAYDTPPHNYINNAISVRDLNDVANSLTLQRKAKVVLITDACHSGKLAGDIVQGKQFVNSQLQRILNDEVRLTSCASDQEAAEGPEWDTGRGVFSYYLLMGMIGFANTGKNDIIKLEDLKKFLDSSFAIDKVLKEKKLKQSPVTDGSPYFPIATVDAATFTSFKTRFSTAASKTILPAGLAAFKPAGVQPIDYFFSLIDTMPLENYFNFQRFQNLGALSLPLKILENCLAYKDSVNREYWMQNFSDARNKDLTVAGTKKSFEDMYNDPIFGDPGKLILLRNQLLKVNSLAKDFNERFVELIHKRGQEMINAYLAGDVSELEKRQYYYTGKRNYNDFLDMLHVAIQIVPNDHYLARILKINQAYLTGLIARLNMATSTKTDSLLKVAFSYQRETLHLERDAAYVYNELGNLCMFKNKYDSAAYYFNIATKAAPTWSIPWSNLSRLDIVLKKWTKANEAFIKADSLQPNLSYVLMNGGWIMEQQKNWLAAETYYLKSIKLNNVHFFPYEHLANIYLNTGRYAEADNFFYHAKLRKESFALNAEYFKQAIAGKPGPDYLKLVPPYQDCFQNKNAGNTKLQIYSLLAIGLRQLEQDSNATGKGALLIKRVLLQKPDIAFANHYLAKKFYESGDWQQAEQYFLQAGKSYDDENNLKAKLKVEIYSEGTATEDSCLLSRLLHYRYDVLEDHYMLAELYEKRGFHNEAAEQYKIASGIENRRQTDQANLANFFSLIDTSLYVVTDWEHSHTIIKNLFGSPIDMAGAIKLSRLYDRLGEYLFEEKTLLAQVNFNRAAGYARQVVKSSNKIGDWAGYLNASYWLVINKDVETETSNFYTRMTDSFPRDPEWQEKAGLFLYDRLALTYNQMPVKEYGLFNLNIASYAYPWMGEMLWESHHRQTTTYILPGTKEKISIEPVKYKPLEKALDYLNHSVSLAGEMPQKETREALADLNGWFGNFEMAADMLKSEIARQPQDASNRNKLINMLTEEYEYVDAKKQLNSLYDQKQIRNNQLVVLAKYHILSQDFTSAEALLREYKPDNVLQKAEEIRQQATLHYLTGKPHIALKYVLDSFPKIKLLEEFEERRQVSSDNELKYFQLYSIARLYAILKQDNNAFDALKAALDSGFNYRDVLENDSAWSRLQKSGKWKDLLQKYQNHIDYGYLDNETSMNVKQYIIPAAANGKVF